MDKLHILAIFSLLSGAIGAYFGYDYGVMKTEKKCETRLTEARNIEIKRCDDDKAITKESNDALQARYADISSRLVDAKRMPTRCIVPKPSPAHKPEASGRTEHDRQDGVTSGALLDYAAECEQYRSERKALEAFEEKVWSRENR